MHFASANLRPPALLIEQPVVNSDYVVNELEVTRRAATSIVNRACEHGILKPVGTMRRGDFYQAPELIAVLDEISSMAGIRRLVAGAISVGQPCSLTVFPRKRRGPESTRPWASSNPNYRKKTDYAELFRARRFGGRRSTRGLGSCRGTGNTRGRRGTRGCWGAGSARSRRGRRGGRTCKLSAAMGTNLNARVVHLSALRAFCRQS